MSGVDVFRARVALRYRPASDVLDLALRFIAVHALAYAKTALVVLLPGILLACAVARYAGWPWAWPVAIGWAVLAQAPFTLLASRLVFEPTVRARDVLASALKSTPRLVFLRVSVVAAVLLGLPFFVLPGIWIAAIFVFATEVVLLERAPIGHSLVRSTRIAHSGMGDALASMALGVLVPVISVILAEYGGRTIIAELLQFRPPPTLLDQGGSVLAMMGLLGAVPYVATARFFTYLNVRTRAEGWDIQTRFSAIAARVASSVREAA